MDDFIKREDAIKAIRADGYEHFSGCLTSSEVLLIEMMEESISQITAADVVPVLPCPEDCIYRGVRHQKCSCCARNRYLKDCYRGKE